MNTTSKHYLIVGRDGKNILTEVREFLSKRLYREFAMYLKTGGRDGDLGHEVMEHDVYRSGNCGGYTTGNAHLYCVIDDGANGYAMCLSLLVTLSEGSADKEDIQSFLQERGFVHSYMSFKERPYSFKHYRSYIDEAQHLDTRAYKYHAPSANEAA